jgi:pimeloyl-ACP methyl ester carboxylesterase
MSAGTDPEASPEFLAVAHDGLRITALDWGGDGPPLLLLHPNGFCAGVFDPLARALRGEYRVVGVDLRGHGGSDDPGTVDRLGYVDCAGDALAVLDHLGITETVVLGESLGGATTILLDSLRPGIVRRMLLCEAIAMPGRDGGAPNGNPLAAGARRRRPVWESREAVLASYGSRLPLSVMEPAALAGYVRWGFHDRSDGQVELACPPEVEAAFFEGGAGGDGSHTAFAHLHHLHAPATLVRGETSDLPVFMFEAQAEALGSELLQVPGGHFFVQESTDLAVSLVHQYLAW